MPIKRLLDRIMASPPGRFIQKYDQDNASLYATVIAYNALLSMFPILFALLAVVGLFVQGERTLQAVNEALVRLLPADVEGDALKVVEASRTESGLFGLIGFLGLLWGGSALFGTMSGAFNRAFGVKDRGFVGQKIMAFSMIFVFALLLLMSIVASSLATFIIGFSRAGIPLGIPVYGWLETVAAWLISLFSAFALFWAVYHIVPNRSFKLSDIWPGAALSAVLFFLIAQVWPVYLATFGRFSRFGAVFGLFFLTLTWFYFLAQILVLGAELNAFLLANRESKAKATSDKWITETNAPE